MCAALPRPKVSSSASMTSDTSPMPSTSIASDATNNTPSSEIFIFLMDDLGITRHQEFLYRRLHALKRGLNRFLPGFSTRFALLENRWYGGRRDDLTKL